MKGLAKVLVSLGLVAVLFIPFLPAGAGMYESIGFSWIKCGGVVTNRTYSTVTFKTHNASNYYYNTTQALTKIDYVLLCQGYQYPSGNVTLPP